MNKYQEALDNLIRASCPKKVSCKECDFEKLCNSQAKGYIDTIQELVDRVTPKKVVIEQYTPAYCPTCGEELSESLGDGYYEYYTHLDVCPNRECRQALDWSDEE